MADRTRRREKPMKRTNFRASSSRPETPYNPNSTIPSITKLLVDDEFPPIVGTCLLMCPVKERERRERLRDLSIFERLNGNPTRSSPTLAVKKFCRTIRRSELEACDVRPIPVLEQTLNHLLTILHSDHPFEIIHDFVFDRTRSIRQDLSMQNSVNDQVIQIYQKMVKFHIISSHYLYESSGTSYAVSMIRLNQEQLIKSLITLYNLYNTVRSSSSICKDESEFFSYFVMLHLASNQHEPLSLWFRSIPYRILKSKEMHFARRLLRYYRLGNYKRFIQTAVEEATFLQYCLIEPYVFEMRVLALSCICYGGYTLQPYPLLHLTKLLVMKEHDVESLCVDCGIDLISGDSGKGLLSSHKLVIKQPDSLRKYYPMHSDRIESLVSEALNLL